METVRKAVAVKAMQCLHSICPMLGECLAAATNYLKRRPAGICRPDFESSGEDDAIDLELDSVEHQAILRDALHALPARIHQRHVGQIKRWEVFVIERWA